MMKKFINVVLVAIVVSLAGILVCSKVSAGNEKFKVGDINVKKTHIAFDNSKALLNTKNISTKEIIVVQGIELPLLPTFDSDKKAIEELSDNQIVKAIKDIYGYDVLSDNNWEDYRFASIDIIDNPKCPDWSAESDEDYMQLIQFFDIYENKADNKETVRCAEGLGERCNATLLREFIYMLPSESQKKIVSNTKFESLKANRPVNGFNINAAVSYAAKYGPSSNTSNYADFGDEDCTNFVSQVLENGGHSQTVTNNEKTGWWHKKKNNKHKHSLSWIRANSFANYMVVGYSTTSHTKFSSNIKKGDFIAADFTNDGEWDHSGFVTDKVTTNNNGYYNYKVAQHSPNYHRWVSEENNHWEGIGLVGGKYGRVRR
ncbi:MAG: amidase domain-containing protein [Lachnospiraceae bacterium]|nr:amidase domain-containing protein [Lachnospiraceae bacterium]